jgi:hypothetical protein
MVIVACTILIIHCITITRDIVIRFWFWCNVIEFHKLTSHVKKVSRARGRCMWSTFWTMLIGRQAFDSVVNGPPHVRWSMIHQLWSTYISQYHSGITTRICPTHHRSFQSSIQANLLDFGRAFRCRLLLDLRIPHLRLSRSTRCMGTNYVPYELFLPCQ